MILLFDEMKRLKCVRSGMILYIKISNNLFFLMGVDKKTKELTDFGGGIKESENVITAGLRELKEETKELVKMEDLEQIKVGIYDRYNSTCVIFCEIKNKSLFTTLHPDFVNLHKIGNEFNELNDVVWLSLNDMIKNVYKENSLIWSRIRRSLADSCDFNDEFIAML